VDDKHSVLATAEYFHRSIAIFVVRMVFQLLKVKVPLICLGTQCVSLRSDARYIDLNRQDFSLITYDDLLFVHASRML
jgi:hypothetical protein